MPRSNLAPLALLAVAAACSADRDQPLAPASMLAAGEAGPHFVRASAEGPDGFGNLPVVWKEAGLGADFIEYLAIANATALYACQNSGGNFSRDAKKQAVAGPVSGGAGLASDRNGTIAGRVTLTPPDPIAPPDPVFHLIRAYGVRAWCWSRPGTRTS